MLDSLFQFDKLLKPQQLQMYNMVVWICVSSMLFSGVAMTSYSAKELKSIDGVKDSWNNRAPVKMILTLLAMPMIDSLLVPVYLSRRGVCALHVFAMYGLYDYSVRMRALREHGNTLFTKEELAKRAT